MRQYPPPQLRPVPGPATVRLAGHGLWRARCETCGTPGEPKARISLALEWVAWHARLRGCLVTGEERTVPATAAAHRRDRSAVA